MFHPLGEDLSRLKDNEVEEKLQELTRKYFLAARMGKPELLTQLSTFVTIYKEELSKRLLAKTQGTYDTDLNQLINVD
jgi:hypothetical protein